jgi:hypothetical protein
MQAHFVNKSQWTGVVKLSLTDEEFRSLFAEMDLVLHSPCLQVRSGPSAGNEHVC